MKNQRTNYPRYKDIMKQPDIRLKWEQTTAKYQDEFKSQVGEAVWFENYDKVIDYIRINDSLPSSGSKDPDVKYLARWLGTQRDNYKILEHNMTTPIIKETWEQFIVTYKKYSKNPRDVWFQSFQRVKDYVKEHRKLPSGESKDKDTRYLGRWIGCQNTNLKKMEHSMNDPEFKALWVEFKTANIGLFPTRYSK